MTRALSETALDKCMQYSVKCGLTWRSTECWWSGKDKVSNHSSIFNPPLGTPVKAEILFLLT